MGDDLLVNSDTTNDLKLTASKGGMEVSSSFS